MPIYVYECEHCHTTDHDIFKPLAEFDSVELCPRCHTQMNRIIPRSQATHIFESSYWHDLDIKPVWIDSKRKLKEECNKRNLIATGYM